MTMLRYLSASKGFSVEASDGKPGTANDVLFDDRIWQLCLPVLARLAATS